MAYVVHNVVPGGVIRARTTNEQDAQILLNEQNISAVSANVGNLANLTTTAKQNLVEAINEVAAGSGQGPEPSPQNNKADAIVNSITSNIATMPDGADNQLMRSVIAYIEPEQDMNGQTMPWPAGSLNMVDASQIISTDRNGHNKYNCPNKLKNSTTYTFSVFGSSTYSYQLMAAHTNEAEPASSLAVTSTAIKSGQKITFTTPSNIENFEYLFFHGSAQGAGIADALFQIEIGSVTKPKYTVYSNICNITGHTAMNVYVSEADQSDYTTLPFDLQTTVYGGSINLSDNGSAVLNNSMVMVDLGSLTWSKGTAPGGYTFFTATLNDKADNYHFVCSGYKTVEGNRTTIPNCAVSVYNNADQYWQQIVIRDDVHGKDTAEEFKAAVNGLQFCYEVAEPQSISMPSIEPLRTALGQNSVWCDTGLTTVTYVADTKLYIDNKIAELIALIVNQ